MNPLLIFFIVIVILILVMIVLNYIANYPIIKVGSVTVKVPEWFTKPIHSLNTAIKGFVTMILDWLATPFKWINDKINAIIPTGKFPIVNRPMPIVPTLLQEIAHVLAFAFILILIFGLIYLITKAGG